jgi:hypothetical protein
LRPCDLDMRLRSSLRDWYLVFAGAVLTAGGVFLGVVKHERKGWGAAVLFGACLAVGVWGIRRKRRIRAHYAALDVQVRGGVPIQGPRRTGLVWTGGMAVLGIALWVFGLGEHWVIKAISVALAGLGTAFFLLVALGVTPRPALIFEPDGLRWVARRRSYLLEWDNLARVRPGELHGHDLLLIDVANHERLYRTASPEYARRLPELVASCRGWYGADLVIMPMGFGLDVALLARLMRRYVEEPATRAELAAPPPLT